MAIKSKMTAQGQISVPADVRRELGLSPGSVLEWRKMDGKFLVGRAGTVTFEDIRKAAFPEGPPPRKSLKQLKEGIAEHIRQKHARD